MMSSLITITDMFCGCGGSTSGAVQAGADVRLAINHWARAIETHNTNHPNVEHRLTDVLSARPGAFPTTTMLIASPECTAHSLAKGRTRKYASQPGLWEARTPDPAEERSRCTMWTPLEWAEYHQYEIVILENVVDVQYWQPLPGWHLAWHHLGYDYQWVCLNSMFAHPTPQSRDRAYFVAWKRGNRKPNLDIRPLAPCPACGHDVEAVQCWKQPGKRFGKYRQQYVYCCPQPECAREVAPYYYPAATAIDWSQPIQRIGDRVRPLKEKTIERIAYGLKKFASYPFTVDITKTSDRLRTVQEPFATQTAVNGQALVLPFLMGLNHQRTQGSPVCIAWPTQTTYDDTALVMPFLAEFHGTSHARSVHEAIGTICTSGSHHGLVIPPAWLMTYYNNGQMSPMEEAAPTVTTLERHALVTAASSQHPRVEDCGFRMLDPEEIKAAMAFLGRDVITGTRREKVKQLGNAVTPPVMKLLVGRCLPTLA